MPTTQEQDNLIIVNAENVGSYIGNQACPYTYKSNLRAIVTECFEAAQQTPFRYFILQGAEVKARTNDKGIAERMREGNQVIVEVQL